MELLRPGSKVDRAAILIAIPLLAVFVLAATLLPANYTTSLVEGDSMLPALESGDRVIVRKSTRGVVRGDIVRFNGPRDVVVLKRVIGVAGDIVEMDSGMATINGYPESGGYDVLTSQDDVSHGPYTVPEGSVYVAGDNRPYSLDSRHYGAVPLERLLGEAMYVYWPTAHAGRVDRASSSD